MRAVVQRVARAQVSVDEAVSGRIETGLLILLGVSAEDTEKDAEYLVEKIVNLRIFPDSDGKLNLSVLDMAGGLLVVSQFTLYGDCRKVRRPSFDRAAPAALAQGLYEYFVDCCRQKTDKVATGVFQADMAVELCNQGPVTMLLDSEKIL